jgi:hypothetical protein
MHSGKRSGHSSRIGPGSLACHPACPRVGGTNATLLSLEQHQSGIHVVDIAWMRDAGSWPPA